MVEFEGPDQKALAEFVAELKAQNIYDSVVIATQRGWGVGSHRLCAVMHIQALGLA